MLKMNKNDEGLTLVELLVVIALVGVVASIAFPVISNVIAGATSDANAASSQAVANFQKEYANFNLAQVGGDIVATTDGGVEIARIAGTLGGGNNGGGNTTVTYNVGTDFTATFNAMAMDFSSRVNYDGMSDRFTSVSIGNPSAALVSALKALPAGATVTLNGVNYTVRSSLGMNGYVTYIENYMGPTAFLLYIDGANNTGTNTPTINLTSVVIP